MSDSSQFHDEHERQLDAIIARYYRAVEEGHPPDQDLFVSQHPEFERDLREFFTNLGLLDGAVPQTEDDPALANTLSMPALQRNKLTDGSVVRYFGEYEILGELGTGGMGVVYKARQTRLGRIVALKMIRAGELANPQDVKRFQAETRAAARLTHAGIVAVHEVGIHNGQHFYTMDYVEGGSLSRLHRDEPVPARHAAEIVKQLAEAIHYSHELGIVHRDLKPANILLAKDGSPKITDFGLAKRMWVDEDSVEASMTETGQILGTAGYMSPEQAAGKTRLVGPPADIYALGAVLYALLTSRAPFVGESQADTIMQVIHREPVSPRALNPSIARDLETICLKCLEKEPHKRYGTAQLLADDMGRFLEGRPVLARPISRPARAWRWCRRNPTLSALGLVVLLVAVVSPLVATQMYRLAGDKEQARKVATEKIKELAVKAAELTDALAREREAISKLAAALDAERQASEAARQSARNERHRRYVSDMNLVAAHWDSGNVVAVTTLLGQYEPQAHKEDLREFVWSMYTHRLKTSAGVTRFPTTVTMPLTTTVSPDGRRIAYVRSSRDRVAYPVGKIHVRQYGAPANTPDDFQLPLSWLNGRVIALAFVQSANILAVHERDKITLWDLSRTVASREDLPLNREGNTSHYVGEGAFSPNGKLLALPRSWNGAYADNPLTRAAESTKPTLCEVWNLEERKVVGKLSLPPLARCLSITDDGDYLADTNGTVWSVSRGETAYSLPGTPDVATAVLLPNGKGIVTQSLRGRLSLWDSDGREIILSEKSATFAVSVPRREISWSSTDGVSVLHLDMFGSEHVLPQPSPLGLVYGPNGNELLAVEANGINRWPLSPRSITQKPFVVPQFKDPRFGPSGGLKRPGIVGADHVTAISPRGTYVMMGTTLWETSSVRQLFSFEYKDLTDGGRRQGARVLGVAVTEKGEVVTCGMDGVVTIWNGLTGKLIASSFQGEVSRTGDESLSCITTSLDGNFLAATTRTGHVVIWNRKQDSFHRLDAGSVTSRPATFAPDGETLGTFNAPPGRHPYDRDVLPIGFNVWSLSTMQIKSTGSPWGDSFPFGDQLVCQKSLADGDTQLISAETGEPISRLGFPLSFSSITATADAKNIATLTAAGKLTIWDSRVAAPLLTVDAKPGRVYFLDSGRVLALIQNDGSIMRWLTNKPEEVHQ